MTMTENENQPVIDVRHLRKNFSDKQVLCDISLQIGAGEVIGYLGTNGAGKSTTVKILCGVISDFEGEVSILNLDLRKEDVAIKYRIGYVPENAVMYEQLTPTEYLDLVGNLYGMPADRIREQTLYWLERFEMMESKDQRMFHFSKGMKQKIHLISGLLHDPDVLFLDEPLNGLDANAVIIVKNLIARLAAQGKTIFYCSHLMDVVEKVATRVILLDAGRILADASPAALKEQYATDSLETVFTRFTRKRTVAGYSPETGM